jgi:hypothetical protein
LAVFLNATEENPSGSGYVVEKGESFSILETPLEAAHNLYLMNDQRVQTLSRFNTYSPALVFFHSLAEDSLNKALTYRDNGMLGSVYGEAFSAWAFEQRAYSLTRSYTFEIIDVTTFLFFLVIPFAFFIERLLLSKTGIYRILGVFGIFSLLILGIGLFHPGFSIASNVSMILMAFTIVILVLPVLGYITGEAASSMKIVRTALMGVHTVDISRGGAIVQAFSTGIESIKKRKSRSLLTIISITLIVFALVTFTSITTIPVPLETPVGESPLYQGLVVRMQPWGALPEEIFRNLMVKYRDEAAVAPRGWWLARTAGRQAGGEAYFLFTPSQLTRIGALLFLSPDEANVSGVDRLLVDGRWFIDSDLYSCIISTEVAESLTEELGREITLKSQIPLWGMNLTVTGLFEADQFDGLRDLDREPLTPLMPVLDWILMSSPPHFPAKNIIIVPFALGLQMRDIVQVMSVGIKPSNPEGISQTAVDLALRTIWDVFVGEGNAIRIVRARSLFSMIGGVYFLIPLAICALVIFNVTLSSVYERTAYIRVYISVGLSPTHVAGMFFAESLVYSIVGSVFGYLLGIIGCNVFGTLGLYPPDFYPNFSSYFVLTVIGISALVSILATVYPANMAWKLVTPSLSRKWSLKGPVGDEWQVTFPFVATEDETKSIFLFLKEFFKVESKEVTRFEAREIEIDMSRMELRGTIQLAPFEAGILQEMIIARTKAGGDKYTFNLMLRKTEGYLSTWIASNKTFIDNIRKQFLVWRSLSPEEKGRYRRLLEEG